MKDKNLANNMLNSIIFILGVTLFISAQSIEAGAGMGQGGDFMPKLCSAIWMVLSGIILLLGFLKTKKVAAEEKQTHEQEKTGINLKGFLMTLALLTIYILLLESVGFVIMSVIYLFIQMLLFTPKEDRNKKKYILFIVIAIVVPIAVNLLFTNVFSLIMPSGILK